MKFTEEQDVVSASLSIDYLITKRKGVFTTEQSGDHHFDQVIKFSIDTRTNKLFAPPVKPQKGCSKIFVMYLPRMQTLNLTMGEQSDRST